MYQLNLPEQTVAAALTSLSEQTDIQVLFPYDIATQHQSTALVGNYPLQQALSILLLNTGLHGGLTDSGVITISRTGSNVDINQNGKGKRMNTNKRKTVLATMVGLFAAGGMSATVAQEQVGESARAQGVLDEIIVTSTRRAESANDVSQSITAIGEDSIQNKNLAGVDDYLRFLPGVNVLSQGPGRNHMVFRGLSVAPQTEALRSGPTVGTYFGEVPLSGLGLQGGTTDLRLVDVERIEVLRGPQGTLFGSNSLAGAVRNIPVEPSLNELEGKFKASYSNTAENGGSNNKVEAVLNIPIIEDVLAVRGVLYRHKDSGFLNNIAASNTDFSDAAEAFGAGALAVNQNGVGDVEYEGGRISALWRPNEAFSMTLTHATQEGEQDGMQDVQIDLGGYNQTRLQFGTLTSPAGVGGVPNIIGETQQDEFDFTNLVLEYDLGWASLLSSTLDYHGDAITASDVLSGLGVPMIFPSVQETDAFIQELRLTSSNDGPLQYIVGLYYEDVDAFYETTSHWLGDLALFPTGGFGVIPAPFGAVTQFDYNLEDKNQKQKAIFGEISYDISDQVELTLGARWFEYKQDNTLGGFGLFSGAPETVKSKESSTNIMTNISYKPTDDTHLYAQYAEGFRPGNTQDAIPDVCDTDNNGILDGTSAEITEGFDSDAVENFEIGAKLGLLDGRIQINTAIYRIDWTGLPVGVRSPTCFFTIIENAGEARSQGIELETAFQVSEDLQINLGASYVDGELTKDADGLGGSKGDRLIGAPEYNFNIGMEYGFELAGNPSFVRGDYAYVGGFYNNFQETGVEAGDYGQLNMSTGVTVDQVSVMLFANNLTNEDAYTWVNSGGLLPQVGNLLRPRTIGLTVGYQF